MKFLKIIPLFFLVNCASTQKVENINNDFVIDWAIVLPIPPNIESEIAAVKLAQGNKSGKLWDQAAKDADLNIFKAYNSILGDEFNEINNPEIAALFDLTLKLSRPSLAKTKEIYLKLRPFEFDKNIELCPKVSASGSSYPSGHAAIGWLYGNILARIYKDKADLIYKRAREYGENRVVCGVHYPSDIIAGRIVGDVLLQKLENNAEFTKLLYFAQEKAKLRVKPK